MLCEAEIDGELVELLQVPNHVPLNCWLVEEEAPAFLDDFLYPSIIKDVFILVLYRLGIGKIFSFLGKMKGI